MFYKDERLALFIDGSNLYAAAKALGFDIDYKLLRQEFMRRGRLLRAFYYTALLENDEYSPIRPLVDWLNYNGFTMVTCDPNPLVAPIHPKAMITILAPEDIDTWLRGSYDEIVALQKPYDPGKMTVRGPMFPTRRDER